MTHLEQGKGLVLLGRELIQGIYEEFEKDRWAITNTGTDHMKVRVYEIGAVMHSSQLLSEILDAAVSKSDLTVNVLSRTHIEASLKGLFIMLGGKDALDSVAADSRREDVTTANELDAWDARLAANIKTARLRIRRVSRKNSELLAWSLRNPNKESKTLLEAPRVPRANFVGSDLSDELRRHLKGVQPERLPFRQVVDKSSNLAINQGFSTEPFDPIYHVYRLISALGTHTSLGLLDSYLDRSERSGFVRGVHNSQTQFATNQNLINGIYTLALFVEWLLTKYGADPSIFSRIRRSLEASSGDLRGWASGL